MNTPHVPTTTSPSMRAARRRARALVVLLATLLSLAACSDDSSETASTTATEPAPASEAETGAEGAGGTEDTVPETDPESADPAPPRSDDDVAPALYDDRILAADIWDDELRILSAGMGFDGVIGWPDEELDTIQGGGGSFYQPECADDPIVSGATAAGVEMFYRGVADDEPDYDDGLPVVFTWPVLTSTVHPEDFLFTLNTGEQVVPNAAGMLPNYELNERNTVVLFGDFGNRLDGDEAVYPGEPRDHRRRHAIALPRPRRRAEWRRSDVDGRRKSIRDRTGAGWRQTEPRRRRGGRGRRSRPDRSGPASE